MEQISKKQTAAMLILFEIGSTPLFELAQEAKQDAWIVVLVGICCGIVLLGLYLLLQRRFPGRNLPEMLTDALGPAGKAAIVLYAGYFTYECFRNLRDIGDLTVQTVLNQSPLSLIMLVIWFLAAYALYKGMESCFLLAELIVPLLIVAYGILMLLFVFSNKLHFDRLLPIFTTDWGTFLMETYQTAWFPFGQAAIFLMFWKYVRDINGLPAFTIRNYMISSLVILVMNIINLAVLGPVITGMVSIPMLEATQMIEIANVFEHFDVLVFLLMYIGIFFKTLLWYLAATLTLGSLFNKGYRTFILPVGAVIYGTTFLPPSWQSHLQTGELVGSWLLVDPLFSLFIPGILLSASLMRTHFRQQKVKGDPQ